MLPPSQVVPHTLVISSPWRKPKMKSSLNPYLHINILQENYPVGKTGPSQIYCFIYLTFLKGSNVALSSSLNKLTCLPKEEEVIFQIFLTSKVGTLIYYLRTKLLCALIKHFSSQITDEQSYFKIPKFSNYIWKAFLENPQINLHILIVYLCTKAHTHTHTHASLSHEETFVKYSRTLLILKEIWILLKYKHQEVFFYKCLL